MNLETLKSKYNKVLEITWESQTGSDPINSLLSSIIFLYEYNLIENENYFVNGKTLYVGFNNDELNEILNSGNLKYVNSDNNVQILKYISSIKLLKNEQSNNQEIIKILTNINTIITRKKNLNDLMALVDANLVEEENEYKLYHIKGVFMPFDEILSEIDRNISEIKEKYNKASNKMEISKSINKDYLEKYYVYYQFKKQGGPIVDCHYMKPEISSFINDCPKINFLKLCLDDGSYIEIYNGITNAHYLHDQQLPIWINIHQIPDKEYLPDNSDIKDFLYINILTMTTKHQGYMNILMCMAAKFANDILNKKYFYFTVNGFAIYATTDDLTNKIYPSFGFYQKGIRDPIMFANIQHVINIDKCLKLYAHD